MFIQYSKATESRMITTDEGFDSALERAAKLLDEHPPEGSAEEQELLQLLSEISHYRPGVTEDMPEGARPHRCPSLERRADALEEQVKRTRYASWMMRLTQAYEGGVGNAMRGGTEPTTPARH